MGRYFRGRVFRARIWRHLRPALYPKRENLYRAQRQESFPYRSLRPGGHRIAGLWGRTGNTCGRVRGEEVSRRGRCTSVHTTRKWAGREGSKTASCIASTRKGRNSPVFRVQDPPRRDYKSGKITMPAFKPTVRSDG